MKTTFYASIGAALLTGALATPATAQESGGRYQVGGENFNDKSAIFESHAQTIG